MTGTTKKKKVHLPTWKTGSKCYVVSILTEAQKHEGLLGNGDETACTHA